MNSGIGLNNPAIMIFAKIIRQTLDTVTRPLMAGHSAGDSARRFIAGTANLSSVSGSHPQPIAPQDFVVGLLGYGLIARQRQNALVDRVDDPFLLREKRLFQFSGRRDPVARPGNRYRPIQVAESKLADVRGYRVQERSAFAGIRG